MSGLSLDAGPFAEMALLLGSATKHVLAEGTVDVLVAGPSPWQAGIKPADGMD